MFKLIVMLKKWDVKIVRILLVKMLMEAHLQKQMQERNQIKMQTFLIRRGGMSGKVLPSDNLLC